MLTELRIQNFAIIDELQLRFDDGLVIFTGETGAGKSIIIDAVETLLGVRADTTVIRSGVEFSSVEGSFRIEDEVREPVHAILEREELLDDKDYVTLAREFRRQGRNVARVNGRMVNLALLKELGELLIDLHGQSEHLSLLRVESHLGLLDRFAEVEKEQDDYRKSYKELQGLRKELNDLRKAEADAERRQELLSFQVEEINTAALEPNEEDELKEERSRLANAESLANHANEALAAIDENDMDAPAATDRMGVVVEALEDLSKLDESQAELSQRAQEVFANVSDLALELRNYLDAIEFNPARLEEVEERLNLISQLKRKYGDSIPEIIAFGEQAQKDLDAITHAEERMAELQASEGKLLKLVAEKAKVLSAKRHAAAEQMSQSIELELDELRMSEAQFGVDFQTKAAPKGLDIGEDEPVAFDATGFETVEFMVAPNPGEGLKPLVKVASGGETARLMLALKNVLASADHTPTLIFDEIDQGIGGRVGAIVGQKLWNLARNHQVLCITHLPQLAGFGEQHYKVDKLVEKGRTTTQVLNMEGEQRLMELAQMLGEVSEGTLQSANEILQSVGKATA
ncbi:MAG: DNA repair protein RecN [Chloroflexi bacterium]|nr:MAG: DNA repair protein RecN [Chloroflexota bacterium]MBL1196271.1 DNA repair protein RecN [Chloroflexota bacterium]NOH13566.1 DNA repair protein RecN [Chloroflexota bacterium]